MLKLFGRQIGLQLLAFYIIFVLPVLLGGLGLYLFERNSLEQAAEKADLGLAQAIALETETNLRGATEIVMTLANSPEASQLDLNRLQSSFAVQASVHSDISLYFVLNPAGTMIVNYPQNLQTIGASFSYRDYFQGVMATHKPFVSAGRVSASTRTNVVTIAAPVNNQAGQLIAIMAINLSVDKLSENLQAVRHKLTSKGDEVRIWIVDNNSHVVANTEGIASQTNLLERLPLSNRILQGETGNQVAIEQNQEWLYSYLPVAGANWTIILQRPTELTFASISQFRNGLIAALVLLVAGASFFWFILNARVIRPLSRIAQAAANLDPEQANRVMQSEAMLVERRRKDEIGGLAEAFARMEAEIISYIENLRALNAKQLEEQLQTLNAIMQSIDEGILLESSDGTIRYANRRFCEGVGLMPGELFSGHYRVSDLSGKLAEMLEDPQSYYQAVQQAENSGPRVADLRLRGLYDRQGRFHLMPRDIRLRMFNVRDFSGQLIGRGKIFQDVTRQNDTERLKNNLLAVVSHELRTPLTIIKGYATGLLDTEVTWDSASQAFCLTQIVEETDRLTDMVSNLLEMSQLEAGTLRLYPALHDLPVLLEAAIKQSLGPNFNKSHLLVEIPPDLPWLKLDGRRIQMVLRNLLENSKHYAGESAIIKIRVQLETENGGPVEPGLYIEVGDNGPGLPPHLTERIFERFFQVDSGWERTSNGIGLGLSICRGFIAAHGGRIWAENRPDPEHGALFRIWLPLEIVEEAANPTPAVLSAGISG